MALWEVWLCNVHYKIVPESRSCCTECPIAEVWPHLTDEEHTSISWAHSSWARIGLWCVGSHQPSSWKHRRITKNTTIEVFFVNMWCCRLLVMGHRSRQLSTEAGELMLIQGNRVSYMFVKFSGVLFPFVGFFLITRHSFSVNALKWISICWNLHPKM